MKIYSKYFKKYALLFLLSISCVGLEAFCDLMGPKLMAGIIDEGIRGQDIDTILRLGTWMLGVTLIGAVFAAARNIIASNTAQLFGEELRYDVFYSILRFQEAGIDAMESGSLITRMTNDTGQIVNFINGMMRFFFKAPVMCIGGVVMALALSPKLSLVMLGVVLAVALLIGISMSLSYKLFYKVQYALDRLNTVVQEYLMGVRLVKAFGRFDEEEEKFGEVNRELCRRSISSQMVIALSSPLMSLSIGLGIAGVLYLGSSLFGAGEIEVGKVAAFITYMTQILHALIMMTNVFQVFVRTKASTQRISEVLTQPQDGAKLNPDPPMAKAALAFEGVSFGYPQGSGKAAVEEISFTLSAGETLAVIGPTGSGKSTLAWLALGFYPVDCGRITLNGEDTRSLPPELLRENISIAPQKSMLFTGTVGENIRWGRPEAAEEAVREAARIACADSFIEEMPQGYDSMLGQGGVNLSGGQKQRISIARAILKAAPVLILDDCTSALDAITEGKVRRGLRELPHKPSVLLITQRVGTAMSADRILVLEQGRVVGLGSHAHLMQSCKTYREIYQSQVGEEDLDV